MFAASVVEGVTHTVSWNSVHVGMAVALCVCVSVCECWTFDPILDAITNAAAFTCHHVRCKKPPINCKRRVNHVCMCARPRWTVHARRSTQTGSDAFACQPPMPLLLRALGICLQCYDKITQQEHTHTHTGRTWAEMATLLVFRKLRLTRARFQWHRLYL